MSILQESDSKYLNTLMVRKLFQFPSIIISERVSEMWHCQLKLMFLFYLLIKESFLFKYFLITESK